MSEVCERGIGSRLPALGPRGEGWAVVQLSLFCGVLLSGHLWPGSWPPSVRAVMQPAAVLALFGGFALSLLGGLRLGGALTPFPRPKPQARLVTTGVYRHVRHPMYTGIVTMTTAWSIFAASVAAACLTALLAVVLDLKARREEAWLLESQPGYAEYRSRTRRFVPRL